MQPIEQRLLRRTWFPLARIEDVTARGVVAGNILGTELVVYHSGGTTTVAEGFCPHRGMRLSMGALRDGKLECPYHGWLFEPGSGRCRQVPSQPDGAAPARSTLRTYPVLEAYGHVWSCLEEPYLPLPDLIGYSAGWQLGFGVPQDLNCGMRQLTENFRDMAHFPFVHTGTMGPNVRREVGPYRVERDGWLLEWTLPTDLGGTALDSNSALANRQTLTYRVVVPMFAYIQTTFPDGGRRLVGQFATPITPDGNRVRQFWFVGIDQIVAEHHGVALPEMWEYERAIFAEDYPIVENQWPPESPLEVDGQAHSRADRYSIVYRRTYAELLQQFEKDTTTEAEPALDGAVR